MNTAKLLSVGEHAHYPFKSYPNTTCETVLFPGCAVPSQFPRTTDALALRCRQAGFGVVYDCCGSPVEGYGEHKSAQRLLRGLVKRLERIGCKRLVLMCPSCTEQLEGKVPFELLSIFDILDELGLEGAGSFDEGKLFIPCPDRRCRAMENSLRASCNLSKVETMSSAPCCGLKPENASRGSAYSSKLGKTVINRADGQMIYSYCASCLGQFSRLGYKNCRLAISVVLGIDEEPDSGKALLNRARRTFDRNTNPLT